MVLESKIKAVANLRSSKCSFLRDGVFLFLPRLVGAEQQLARASCI